MELEDQRRRAANVSKRERRPKSVAKRYCTRQLKYDIVVNAKDKTEQKDEDEQFSLAALG